MKSHTVAPVNIFKCGVCPYSVKAVGAFVVASSLAKQKD